MSQLDQLITLLAGRRAALAVMQDEGEHVMAHCEKIEIECEVLVVKIGEVAVATGKEQPHVAVKVTPHFVDGDLNIPRVEIDSDLSPYRFGSG